MLLLSDLAPVMWEERERVEVIWLDVEREDVIKEPRLLADVMFALVDWLPVTPLIGSWSILMGVSVSMRIP